MDERAQGWISELESHIERQASTSWTVARMRLVYPGMPAIRSSTTIDTVSAAGKCSAQATVARWHDETARAHVDATFADFELRGQSPILGRFRIILQEGQQAIGRFRQRYSDRLWPLHGTWTVPFVIETPLGRMIPRPTDDEVVLRSAEPGEFAIPPIGSWFEKWDPINLVLESDADGPTIAICQQAMHVMLNVGDQPEVPSFYWTE